MKRRARAVSFQSMQYARAAFLVFGVSRGRVLLLYLHAASASHQVARSNNLARSSYFWLMPEGQFEGKPRYCHVCTGRRRAISLRSPHFLAIAAFQMNAIVHS
jgi:hypothetical protein